MDRIGPVTGTTRPLSKRKRPHQKCMRRWQKPRLRRHRHHPMRHQKTNAFGQRHWRVGLRGRPTLIWTGSSELGGVAVSNAAMLRPAFPQCQVICKPDMALRGPKRVPPPVRPSCSSTDLLLIILLGPACNRKWPGLAIKHLRLICRHMATPQQMPMTRQIWRSLLSPWRNKKWIGNRCISSPIRWGHWLPSPWPKRCQRHR